ncbi:MAG: hypothetical protein M0C28_04985 [Candidatus Moduliflexus flocculans]|nr:hypothetical protein [Candidatus Moduliflexus flocculans]
MDEDKLKRIAVFRFGVIADFVDGRTLDRGETERLMRDKCARKWTIPNSVRTRIGESTIKEWVARYKASGNKLESLYPRGRSDKGKPRAIDEETAMGLKTLRKELPEVSLPVLMQQARHRKIILPGEKVTYSALYRFLQAEGLLDKPSAAPQDRRKFEAEAPNALWQADVMHGPSVSCGGQAEEDLSDRLSGRPQPFDSSCGVLSSRAAGVLSGCLPESPSDAGHPEETLRG